MQILCKKATVVLEFVKNLGSSKVQLGPIPSHVMNPRVLKRPLEDKVKQLMLTKTKLLSLKKLNIFTTDNIVNDTKGILFTLDENSRIPNHKLPIHLKWFCNISSVLSILKREETFRRWKKNKQWFNNKL